MGSLITIIKYLSTMKTFACPVAGATANDEDFLNQIADEVNAIKVIADSISGDDNTHWDDFKNNVEEMVGEMEPDLKIAFADNDLSVPSVLQTEESAEPAAL